MVLEVESLLIVLASVMMVAILAQVIVFWRLAQSTKQLMEKLENVSRELETEARQIIDQLQGVVDSFQNLRTISESVENQANEISQLFGERVHDIDKLVGTLLEVGSRQAEKVDAVISDTVQKFQETTEVIQQDIVRPVVEISSLVKGLKTGLEYLFSKKQISSEESYPEDELFI